MKVTAEKNKQVEKMVFGTIYPLYLNRLVKNGRTKEELNQVIEWLTGFNTDKINTLIEEKATYKTVFKNTELHPNSHSIKGVVCGYRIEEIEDQFEVYKKCRMLEKLIDELAKGRKMDKILRKEKK